jgi:hypothetical protein
MANICSHIIGSCPNYQSPKLVENRRRSVAMLPPGAPALNRDEALELLRQLRDALREIRDLRRVESHPTGTGGARPASGCTADPS